MGQIWPTGCSLLTFAQENSPKYSWGQQNRPLTHPKGPAALSREAVCRQMSIHKSHENLIMAVRVNTGSLFLHSYLEKRGKNPCCFSSIYSFIFHFHQKRGKLLNACKFPSVHNDIATLRRRKTVIKLEQLCPYCARLNPPRGSRQAHQDLWLRDRHGENPTMEFIKSQLLWGAVLFNWFIFLIQGL